MKSFKKKNQPKEKKMVEPYYEMLWKKDIPVAKLNSKDNSFDANNNKSEDNAWIGSGTGTVEIKVICGRINNLISPTSNWIVPFSYYHCKIDPKTSLLLKHPHSHTAFFYVINGKAHVEESIVNKESFALFSSSSNENQQFVEIENRESEVLDLLFLEGNPIKDKIVHRGPFVMNSQQEIVQAHIDFSNGEFGELDHPFTIMDA